MLRHASKHLCAAPKNGCCGMLRLHMLGLYAFILGGREAGMVLRAFVLMHLTNASVCAFISAVCF